MLIKVRVIFGAGKPHFDGDTLVIHTTEKPEKGMANRDVISQAAKFYHIPVASVSIKMGLKSRKKILEVKGIDFGPSK